MGSRKRWQKLYEGENPFELPQVVSTALRNCACQKATDADEKVDFVWLYAAENPNEGNGSESVLGKDDWLGVVDEAAMLGAKSLVISLCCSLGDRRELIEVCEWAIETHNMCVALHFYRNRLSESDARLLGELDPKKLCILADRDVFEGMRFVEKLGLHLCSSEGSDGEAVERLCEWPCSMPCIGADGSMYTCGLVLGDEHYRLGNIMDRKLEAIMGDESLPHTIPQGQPRRTRKCNGCPPLMARRIGRADH